MTVKCLALLYFAVGDRWPAHAEGAATFDVNMGSVFAHHLCQLKTLRAYRAGKREEYVGSLLTPLFEAVGLDMSLTRCDRGTAGTLMDEAHLGSVHILKVHPPGSVNTYSYIWHHRSGHRLVRLPSEYTDIDTASDLEFELPHGAWMQASATAEDRRLRSRARRAAQAPPPPPASSAAFLGDFTYPEETVYRDEEEYRRYSVGILAKIWGALSGIQRSCRCARPEDVIPPRPPPRSHDAEAGGSRPAGLRAGDDDDDEDEEYAEDSGDGDGDETSGSVRF